MCMRVSINESLSIINESFTMGSIDLFGIDDIEILYGSDDYGISWDILTQNIKIYHNGEQISFIPKIITQEVIDCKLYDLFIEHLIRSIDEYIIEEIRRYEKKCVIFEDYENAQKVKEFISVVT